MNMGGKWHPYIGCVVQKDDGSKGVIFGTGFQIAMEPAVSQTQAPFRSPMLQSHVQGVRTSNTSLIPLKKLNTTYTLMGRVKSSDASLWSTYKAASDKFQQPEDVTKCISKPADVTTKDKLKNETLRL